MALYVIIFLAKYARTRIYIGYLACVIVVSLGYLLANNKYALNNKNHFSLYPTIEFYSGTIATLVEEKEKSWKAIVNIDKILNKNISQQVKGQAIIYLDKVSIKKPKYGDVLLIKGKPIEVSSPLNPFEFDYKKYLANQGIFHQHYLKDTSFVNIGNDPPNKLLKIAIDLNSYCDSVFTKNIKLKSNYAVANAMILGLRDDIDNDLIQAYSAAGAIHVLSVSGLHVGVIYAVLIWFFGAIKNKGKYGKWWFFTIIFFILWFYAMVSGLSSPVLRSTIMFSIILLAETINRKANAYNTVAFSAFLLLIYNPFFVTNVGFLLSYLAVFGMIHIQPLLNPIFIIDKSKNMYYWMLDRLWKITTVAVAAQIATLPITIYFFHQFPNYFLFANPIVIALSSVVLIAGLLFLFLAFVFNFFHLNTITENIGGLVEYAVNLLNQSVRFTESLPGAITKFLYITSLEMALLYFLIICILALIYTKKYIWVKLALAISAFLVSTNILERSKYKNQEIVCIQAIPKHLAINFIIGQKATLFADSEFIKDRKGINFRIANYWAAKGVLDTLKVGLEESANPFVLLKLKEKAILILNSSLKNKAIKISPQQKIDFLIINHKEIRFKNDIQGKINFKYLILNGNLSNFYAKRFQNEASQFGINAHYVLDKGAFIF